VDDTADKVHWMEVKIHCDGELAEALAEVLGRFVSNGVVIESVTRFNPHIQEHEPTGEMVVFGYLALDQTIEDKKHKLAEALWHLGQIAPIPEPKFTPIHDANWMETWKEHYQPIPIGKDLLILPAWHQLKDEKERIVVRINPAMAFGTGAHPTTQLCLRLLERYFQPGKNLIDVGCGSGILSIAAIKMGAAHALAVDVDEQAVTATLENAEINELPEGVLEVGIGSVPEILSGQFSFLQAPLVVVNILTSVILGLFNQGLGTLVTGDGILLLSGILKDQELEVCRAAAEAGFGSIERLTDGDWVSLALEKG